MKCRECCMKRKRRKQRNKLYLNLQNPKSGFERDPMLSIERDRHNIPLPPGEKKRKRVVSHRQVVPPLLLCRIQQNRERSPWIVPKRCSPSPAPTDLSFLYPCNYFNSSYLPTSFGDTTITMPGQGSMKK